jgi:endonuclease/exonuclease/phosphatase family metal-dependent hydrolase
MKAIWAGIAISAALLQPVTADQLTIGNWNIANLHHENDVALRPGSQPRDAEDFERLRAYADSLAFDIVALQEIGSPAALARIFPESEYHLLMEGRYQPGDELNPPEERDIFNAFAVRKSRFPGVPVAETLDGLALSHIEIDNKGKESNRPTRAGLVLTLALGDRTIRILNVHLKSSCHGNSLDPVFDTRRDGPLNANRYDCRTLAAQAHILENWIEQQAQLNRSVIVLGDFNRRLNRFDDQPNGADHFWEMINDGEPNGLMLRKGPLGKNITCWPNHTLFHEEHIDFIVFDTALDPFLSTDAIAKLALPHQDHPKYANEGDRLSDHCPIVGKVTFDGEIAKLAAAENE